MMSQKLTRLSWRVFAMSSALALVAVVWVGGSGQAAATRQASSDPRPTIVLVHGDWADTSSWNRVIERLQDRGFTVVGPPNTLRGPSQDAPYLASYLQMYERAGAHVSRVKAGHLSLITRPDAVVRVILSAVEATT